MVSYSTDLKWGCDAATWAREALSMNPDPWQARILCSSSPRLMLNITRQGGKSSTTAALAAHTSVYQPGSLTLLVSPSLRQSAELFRKVTAHLERLPTALQPKRTEDNKLSYTLANGSRIVSLPSSEATVRGFSAVDLLIEDEASRVPDALYLAVRPMLAVSAGRLVLMSTPWGKRGHFYDAWANGGPAWERIQVTAHECPRISPRFLAEERAVLGDLWFRSEYLCEFAETVDSAFSYAAVEATVRDDVAPLFGNGGATAGTTEDDPFGMGGADVAPLFPL